MPLCAIVSCEGPVAEWSIAKQRRGNCRAFLEQGIAGSIPSNHGVFTSVNLSEKVNLHVDFILVYEHMNACGSDPSCFHQRSNGKMWHTATAGASYFRDTFAQGLITLGKPWLMHDFLECFQERKNTKKNLQQRNACLEVQLLTRNASVTSTALDGWAEDSTVSAWAWGSSSFIVNLSEAEDWAWMVLWE